MLEPQANGGVSVHLYTEDHPALARTLRSKLVKARQKVSEDLIYAGDWADFKRRVGMIAGLSEAIDHCKRAEQELHGDTPNDPIRHKPVKLNDDAARWL